MKLSRSRLPSWLWARMAHLSWHLLPSMVSQAFFLCWVSLQQIQSKNSQVIISFLNWHYKKAALIFSLAVTSFQHTGNATNINVSTEVIFPCPLLIYIRFPGNIKNQKGSKNLDIVKVKMHPASNLFSMLLKNETNWRKVMQRYDSVRT